MSLEETLFVSGELTISHKDGRQNYATPLNTVPQDPRYDFENGGGGHIREASRFTITLGANKISNFKGK